MRVMAIDAVVPVAWSFGQIPMAAHSSMSAVLIIPGLGAMTLGAELHDVAEFQPSAIRQTQAVVVLGIVAAQTGEIAMLNMKMLMEAGEFLRISQFPVGGGAGMAG
jgi:hypothetical protein